MNKDVILFLNTQETFAERKQRGKWALTICQRQANMSRIEFKNVEHEFRLKK